MDEVEKQHIRRVLDQTHCNIKAAGQILGISRTTMWRKLKKYDISISKKKSD